MGKLAKLLPAILCFAGSLTAHGDDNSVSGFYWFNNSNEPTLFTPGHLEIDATALPDGVNTLNLYVVDENGILSSPHSRLFLKDRVFNGHSKADLVLAVDGKAWQTISGAEIVNGVISKSLDTDGLTEGLHRLEARADIDGQISSTVSGWFLKTLDIKAGETYSIVSFIDGKPWHTFETQASGNSVVSLDLDMNSLPLGLHYLQVQVASKSGIVSDMKESFFMRVPTKAQFSSLKGYYAIDNKFVGEVASTSNGEQFHFDIDVSSLLSGLHSLSIYMSGDQGMTTSLETAWFIKVPEGGSGIHEYEYWLNGNYASMKHVVLDKVQNPLSLLSLIEVAEEPFRSTSYSFAIENNTPVAYALNDFQVRFFDPDGHITIGNRQYVDSRVKRPATEITRLTESTTYTLSRLDDNDIRWHSFEAEAGDSISVKLDRSAMYEVFDGDGEKIMAVSGNESLANQSYSVSKTGKYFLAVHDIASSNKSGLKLNYQHIPRFALLSSTPEKAGASDYIFMDIRGNGFDRLKSLSITGTGQKYAIDSIGVKSRYDLKAWIDIDSLQLTPGVYGLEAIFDDDGTEKAVTKPAALELIPRGKAIVKTELVKPRIAQTPYEVYVDIVNETDQQCWGVPVNIAAADNKNGTSLELLNFFALEGDTVKPEVPDYFITDNLLATGQSGVMIPVVVPYLGPKETIRLKLGIYSAPHDPLNMYVWNGEPWSEEFREILAPGFDFDEINNLDETNLLSARELVYTMAIEDEEEAGIASVQKPGMRRTKVVKVAYTAGRAAAPSYARAATIIKGEAFKSNFGSYVVGTGSAGLVNTTLINRGFNTVGNTTVLNPNSFFLNYPNAKKIKIKFKRKNSGGGSSGGSGGDKPENPSPMPPMNLVDPLQSGDPNDMTGYIAPSGSNYMSSEVKSINYTIEFENDPEIANASASEIRVDNVLPKGRFDLSSFVPKLMRIGSKEMSLPTSHSFITTMDMRPEINAIAELTFNYDQATGTASWSLQSLDPMTMAPTKYADDGILPVNDDTNRGTGYLTYSIALLPEIGDGVSIENKATIIFDDNEPISTPVWTNITDYTKPEASIMSQASDNNMTFNFDIEGSDTGSGIWYYDIYLRSQDGATWTLIKPHVEETSVSHTFDEPVEGAVFAVIATDKAGNVQDNSILSSLLGDADGNGSIDAGDIVFIRNYYTGASQNINKVNADINVDGQIDAQDATFIRNIYVANKARQVRKRMYNKTQEK